MNLKVLIVNNECYNVKFTITKLNIDNCFCLLLTLFKHFIIIMGNK